jgi:hypothetical protein
VRYTDIVKARALRRAGRACEMCGAPVGFESAQFVSAHPIFGVLFDQDDCCVLCDDCLADLDPETRLAAERGPSATARGHEACPDSVGGTDLGVAEETTTDEQAERGPDSPDASVPRAVPRTVRETRLPDPGPDGDMCA